MYTGGPPPAKVPPSRSSHVVVRQHAGDPAPKTHGSQEESREENGEEGREEGGPQERELLGARHQPHRPGVVGDASHGGKEKAFKAAVKWLKSKQS
jgi:hypothetical protein